jgi:hypothetical protein
VVTDVAFDYPSQRSGRQFPWGPMLLDTCLLQHLKLVMDVIGEDEWLTDDGADYLRRRPGALGDELVALADVVNVLHRNGPPWVVSESSLIEMERAKGRKGVELRRWWYEWADYFDACFEGGWYPGLDRARLLVRHDPGVADGQQCLPIEPARPPLSAECVAPLGPFRDSGDRVLIRTALRAGIPTILTTDLRSLWRHRCALYPLGIEIWCPTDLWATLFREAA